MKKLLVLIVVLVVAFIVYALFWPTDFAPQSWTPTSQAPAAQDAYADNQALADVEWLARGVANGPEDVAIDNQGRLYAGYDDGTIRRFDADGGNGTVFATTNGRPLGLAFGPSLPKPAGNDTTPEVDSADGSDGTSDGDQRQNAQTLFVADAKKGLLAIDDEGEIRILAAGANGTRFAFTDDVDVGDNGMVYFSDASSKYGQADYVTDILEHGGHGRLLQYNPQSGRTRVLLTGLQFANGVAVGPDDAYVLVNETGSYRVIRYWLTGDKAGQREIFIDDLPAFPDGISFNGDGTFWLALFGPRDPMLDFAADKPWLRRIIFRLPKALQPAPPHIGHVVGLDTEGEVIADLQDTSEDAFAPVTSAEQAGDMLYLGSLTAPGFARIPAPEPTQ